MDAGAADPLRVARPEEGEEKPKLTENQDDGYETSNSGEARRKPSSAEGSPAPAPEPSPPPEPEPEPEQEAPYEALMQRPYPTPYRHFEAPTGVPPPPPPDQEQYQHFPFPKYNDPYSFKRDDAPYDMSQHQHHSYPPPKREEDLYNGIKRECEDPYSFVEDEAAMCAMLGQPPHGMHMPHHDQHQHPHMQMHPHQMMLSQPKKRGRKKKIKDENNMEIKLEGGLEGALVPRPVKERKKHDRFNGMSEEEVCRRTLPDHLAENLDIVIIGINPGLFAAYKGHHYAGPGNHFWKCLYLSGLTREQMSADEDYKLLNFGIGFTNMVSRPTKGSADLTRREIKEGSTILLEKLQRCRPKVAVFNGKLIYEVFSGKKDFCFGKQPDTITGTNTYMWVMPSSSARCAQLPRAADKVPFYAALKKFRDYLNGLVPHIEESELVFPDNTSRRPQEEMEIRRLTMEPEPGDTIILEDGTEVPLKKKRGRPKKVKLENGEVVPPTPRAPRAPRPPPCVDPNVPAGEQPPKKKRGRPKKVRPEDQQFILQQQQSQQQQQQQQQQPTNPILSQPLPSIQGIHDQQYMPQQNDFQSQLPESMGQGMMYPHQQHQTQHPHQTLPPDGSPYFQAPNSGGNMDGPLDMAGLGMGRGYASPGGGGTGNSGSSVPGGGYAASPHGVYASPRSQGYSPGSARPAGTPQPQYESSPAAFSAPSPPGPGATSVAPGGGPRGFGSPARFSGRSPAGYQQLSPARPPFAQSPAPYNHSPVPQAQARPYSRSPVPAGATTPFPAQSPAGAGPLHSYTPSPAHTPYSQHSSPAPAPLTPAYGSPHHFAPQGGSTNSGSGSGSGFGAELSSEIGAAISSPGPVSPGMAAIDFEPPRDARTDASPMGSTDMHPGSNSNSSLSDYNKPNPGGNEMSPAAVGGSSFGGTLYDGEQRLPYPHDKDHYHYQQERGVADSPRLDQLHQHPSMYPSNFNRQTPPGGGGSTGGGEGESPFSPHAAPAFRPPDHPPHTPHSHHGPGSPSEYGGGQVKTKSQDVASKSLSGLESLVDQIPSIAEGQGAPPGGGEQPPPAPPPPLPEYPPALYGAYGAYGGAAYGNNGYGAPFVGYGGGWGGQLMRPTPGYLSDWQYGYATGVPGVPAVPGSYPYNAPYYNGYAGPPPAHHQQPHYLSAPPLIDLHKNGEHSAGVPPVPSVPSVPSVGFGGFC